MLTNVSGTDGRAEDHAWDHPGAGDLPVEAHPRAFADHLRAYPNNPAARKQMRPQTKWSRPR